MCWSSFEKREKILKKRKLCSYNVECKVLIYENGQVYVTCGKIAINI